MTGLTTIQTFSGAAIDLEHVERALIDPLDIAVALSRTARWGGHTDVPYTVAQHSLYASALAPRNLELTALLHDASEAYLGDCVRPLKALLGSAWGAIEQRVERAIALRFGLVWPWPQVVHDIDERLLATEYRDLLRARVDSFGRPFEFPIVPHKPRRVLRQFVARFEFMAGEPIDRGRLPRSRKAWLRGRQRGAA